MVSGKPQHVLALGFSAGFDALAGRLLLLNFRAARAALIEDGVRVLERSGEPIRAVLVSVPHALGDLAFALGRLREHASTPSLRFVAVGVRPGRSGLAELHAAGVEFSLWEPFDDIALRFVVNEAIAPASYQELRQARRVPTTIMARVFSSVGEKAALVYSLSTRGAFLETLRPTSSKGHVRLELALPSGAVTVEARVLNTNVPGNLLRPNQPMGMGVVFVDVPEETHRAIGDYVASLVERFHIGKPDPA